MSKYGDIKVDMCQTNLRSFFTLKENENALKPSCFVKDLINVKIQYMFCFYNPLSESFELYHKKILPSVLD